MDNSPETEEDTASGGAPEPRDGEGSAHDVASGAEAAHPGDSDGPTGPPDTTDDDGTPVENPAG